MHRVELSDPAGVRWLPGEATGVGVLVLGVDHPTGDRFSGADFGR